MTSHDCPPKTSIVYTLSHNHGSGTWGPEGDFSVPFSTSMIMGGRWRKDIQYDSDSISSSQFQSEDQTHSGFFGGEVPKNSDSLLQQCDLLNSKQSKEGEVKEKRVRPNRFTLSDVLRFKFVDLLEKGDISSSLPMHLHPII